MRTKPKSDPGARTFLSAAMTDAPDAAPVLAGPGGVRTSLRTGMANATTIEPPFVPQGHSTLAHPFMGGSNLLRTASPGRDERIASVASSSVQVLLHVLHALPLESYLELIPERHRAVASAVPDGTYAAPPPYPALKTLGCCRLSLRDKSRVDSSIPGGMGQECPRAGAVSGYHVHF
jgi:hypothetical protein